jgi:hypothetical protein
MTTWMGVNTRRAGADRAMAAIAAVAGVYLAGAALCDAGHVILPLRLDQNPLR